MKVSLDGGALCSDASHQFGNYTFSEELIHALGEYDKENRYYIYTFCRSKIALEGNMQQVVIRPKQLWMQLRVSIEELMHSKNIFLALNQSIPFVTHASVVSFSHGLSFVQFPKYYPDSIHQLKRQLQMMAKKSNYIIVSSIKVKNELLMLYPKLTNIIVIPFGIPHDFSSTFSNKKKENYFLYVGMDNGIKNIDFIIDSFTKFAKKNNKFKLFLVGVSQQYEKRSNLIKTFTHVNRDMLKKLYQNAVAILTASHYESFNLPVLEALSQNCPVIGLSSAIIPELSTYVNIAQNEKEFIELMDQAIENKLPTINIHRLRSEFSWKEYVEKLKSLY